MKTSKTIEKIIKRKPDFVSKRINNISEIKPGDWVVYYYNGDIDEPQHCTVKKFNDGIGVLEDVFEHKMIQITEENLKHFSKIEKYKEN